MAHKKMGRPPAEKPLKDRIFVLVSDETKEKLAQCKEEMNMTTSDIVRKGIDMVHDGLKKK
ncbi:MAG: CopG family transcriptional regulator [Clostridiales bacterium 43-6]|nr:MAG: CopG family transcriptional regulator [Clostridiales bacterium 43-6]